MSSHSDRCQLAVEDLEVQYGVVRALQSVSIEVDAGAITAVVGVNGAGKSSLLKAVVGLVRARAGDILSAGGPGAMESVLRARAWDRPVRFGIAYVPEGRGLFPRMSLDENLSFGEAIGRRRSPERWEREATPRDEVETMFPALAGRGSTVIANLSGGEQQMAAIARALLMDPTTLLLDEPSIGLAPVVEEEVFRALRERVAETGLAVLVAEQRLDVALRNSDHAYLLERGVVRAAGPPGVLAEDPHVADIYLGGAVS